jgi:hypothetical protein
VIMVEQGLVRLKNMIEQSMFKFESHKISARRALIYSFLIARSHFFAVRLNKKTIVNSQQKTSNAGLNPLRLYQ